MGVVVPTAVVGLASTVIPVEVAGRRLFVAVVALGTLVLPVQNMLCVAEVVVRIQAALVLLYCPCSTLGVGPELQGLEAFQCGEEHNPPPPPCTGNAKEK